MLVRVRLVRLVISVGKWPYVSLIINPVIDAWGQTTYSVQPPSPPPRAIIAVASSLHRGGEKKSVVHTKINNTKTSPNIIRPRKNAEVAERCPIFATIPRKSHRGLNRAGRCGSLVNRFL